MEISDNIQLPEIPTTTSGSIQGSLLLKESILYEFRESTYIDNNKMMRIR